MNNLSNKKNLSILACQDTSPSKNGYVELLSYGGILYVANQLFDNNGNAIPQKINNSTTILPPGTYTVTSLLDAFNTNFRGAHFIISVTVMTAGSLIPKLIGIDNESNSYDLLIGPTITSPGVYVMKIYPGITEIVSEAVSDILPYLSQLRITPSTTDPITYSATVNMVM